MEDTQTVFRKLLTLLASKNEDSFRLGLVLAVNFQQEFECHFGCTISEYTNLINLLVLDTEYYVFGMNIKELIHLKLDGKQLKKLPKEIKYLVNLKSLRLGQNQLTKFPKEIIQLTDLEYLNLNHNQIGNVPKKIILLDKLDYFRLDNNQIITLPKEILQIENLEYLNLKNNPLSEKTKKMLTKKNKSLKLEL